jgi:cyclophilin family peptidyl-prolyl cis-trans isomerase/photosystem II stability/assembly factor-like uncharacterized protein
MSSTLRSLAALVLAPALVGLSIAALWPTAAARPAESPAWRTVSMATDNRLYAVSMASASEGWAVGDYGTMFHYHDGAWQSVMTATMSTLLAVDAVAADDVWAVGGGGTILHYDGAWRTITSTTAVALRGLAMVSPTEGWAVGDSGAILQYDHGAWRAAQSPTTERLFAIDMVSPQAGWAVGMNGTVLHHADGTWQAVDAHAGAAVLRSVDFVNADEGWAAGYVNEAGIYHGVLLHYRQGSWQAVPSPIDNQLQSVSMATADEGWVVGDGDVMLHYQNGAWQVVAGPQCFAFLRAVTVLSPTEAWAVGQFTGYTSVIQHYGADRSPPPTTSATSSPSPTRRMHDPTPRAPMLPTPGLRPLATLAPAERVGYYSDPPPMQIDPQQDYSAVFRTEVGDFRIDLLEDEAPITVNNFVVLALNGFYDQSTFHRVLQDFVAQGGDPGGNGEGDPGYAFDDEFVCGLKFDRIGRFAMANAGPNTNGSQFFITYAQTPSLYGNHTIFGQVTEGMDVVDKIKLRDPSQSPDYPGTLILRIDIEPAVTGGGRLFLPVARRGEG